MKIIETPFSAKTHVEPEYPLNAEHADASNDRTHNPNYNPNTCYKNHTIKQKQNTNIAVRR